MASTCFREATSGTTPPKLAWRSIWEEITFERMVPSSTSAAAVSSQEVSIPRINMVVFPLGLGPLLALQQQSLGQRFLQIERRQRQGVVSVAFPEAGQGYPGEDAPPRRVGWAAETGQRTQLLGQDLAVEVSRLAQKQRWFLHRHCQAL